MKAGVVPESTKPDAAPPDKRRDCLAEAGREPENTKPAAYKSKQEVHTMSTNEMESKIRELRQLQALIDEATAEAEAIKDTIKADMTAQGAEELRAGEYPG